MAKKLKDEKTLIDFLAKLGARISELNERGGVKPNKNSRTDGLKHLYVCVCDMPNHSAGAQLTYYIYAIPKREIRRVVRINYIGHSIIYEVRVTSWKSPATKTGV